MLHHLSSTRHLGEGGVLLVQAPRHARGVMDDVVRGKVVAVGAAWRGRGMIGEGDKAQVTLLILGRVEQRNDCILWRM